MPLIERDVVWVQSHGWTVRDCDSASELAEYLVALGTSAAHRPYRDDGAYALATPCGGIRKSAKLNDAPGTSCGDADVLAAMLEQYDGVSATMARSRARGEAHQVAFD